MSEQKDDTRNSGELRCSTGKDTGVLAWEHFTDDDVQVIWRVLWLRKWGSEKKRVHRCTDYFNDEKAAWEFAGKWTEAGHDIIRVDRFELKPAP